MPFESRKAKWNTAGSFQGTISNTEGFPTDLNPALADYVENLLTSLGQYGVIKISSPSQVDTSVKKHCKLEYMAVNDQTGYTVVRVNKDHRSLPVLFYSLDNILRAILENLSLDQLIVSGAKIASDPQNLFKLIVALYPDLRAKDPESTRHIQVLLVLILWKNPDMEFVRLLSREQGKILNNIVSELISDQKIKGKIQEKIQSGGLSIPTVSKHSKQKTKDDTVKDAFADTPFVINYDIRKGPDAPLRTQDTIILPEHPNKKFKIVESSQSTPNQAVIVYEDDLGAKHSLLKGKDNAWYEQGILGANVQLVKRYDDNGMSFVVFKDNVEYRMVSVRTDSEDIKFSFKDEDGKTASFSLEGSYRQNEDGDIVLENFIPRNKGALTELIEFSSKNGLIQFNAKTGMKPKGGA